MVCAFKGWNDAGESASAALSFIRGSFEAEDVAGIDPEEYYDFTAVRPTVRLTEGRTREMDWPENQFSIAEVPGAEGDLVMLQGVEPSLRWRRFTDNVIGTARELDVSMVITLGALLADVPHSRPVAITGFGSDNSLVERLGFEPPSYEGPTGIVGVLQNACASAGVRLGEPVGLGAALRGGVAEPEGGARARARLRGGRRGGGRRGELESAAEDYERQVSAAVASDPEVKAFVERLENADGRGYRGEPARRGDLPSADTIARDFQRFLRQRGEPPAGAAGPGPERLTSSRRPGR